MNTSFGEDSLNSDTTGSHSGPFGQQYYTPAIEDLHVGYECETRSLITYEAGTENERVVESWFPHVIQHIFNNIHHDFFKSSPVYRTPYLTKEQIEAEGWDLVAEYESGNFWLKFQKIPNIGNPVILHYNDKKWLLISQEPLVEGTLPKNYSGSCPSINEFRKICKLLGI